MKAKKGGVGLQVLLSTTLGIYKKNSKKGQHYHNSK